MQRRLPAAELGIEPLSLRLPGSVLPKHAFQIGYIVPHPGPQPCRLVGKLPERPGAAQIARCLNAQRLPAGPLKPLHDPGQLLPAGLRTGQRHSIQHIAQPNQQRRVVPKPPQQLCEDVAHCIAELVLLPFLGFTPRQQLQKHTDCSAVRIQVYPQLGQAL